VKPGKASGRITPEGETARASVLLGGENRREATTSQPARQQPQPPAAPDPFERLGPWEILRRDSTGKRATARCTNCLAVREISIADNMIANCGCARARPPGSVSFASSIVAAEMRQAPNKHRGGGRDP